MKRIQEKGSRILKEGPKIEEGTVFCGYTIVNDLNRFKQDCDVILANRYDTRLEDVKEKVYTRDIFMRD